MDMTTITSGAIALEKPMFCARSTRKASEKRASVSTPAMPTTMVKLRPSLDASDQRMRGLRELAAGGRSGSSTPKMMSTTASIAGTTAIQNTDWKLLAKYHIAASASSGPPIPPTVSSAWRRPKLRPRAVGRRDVGDQRVARCAANALAQAVGKARADDPGQRRRQRERELGERRNAIAEQHQRLAAAEEIGEDAGEQLDDQRQRFGHALDQPITNTEAPSAVAMYSGSSAWISSDERSMHMLTRPSTHTPRGTAASPRRAVACSATPCLSPDRCSRRRSEQPAGGHWNAAVRSPAPARTPGSGVRPKRSVMNLMMDVVS